jgi:hypothetical protein
MNGTSSRTVQPEAVPMYEIHTGDIVCKTFFNYCNWKCTDFAQEDEAEPGFIRLSPRTHDITNTEHHVPNIQQVAADLSSAIQAAWPKRHKIRYSQVLVLLLSWEHDDLGVHTEIDSLQNVFENMYHFSVTRFNIPSLKPGIEVSKCIMEFLEHDQNETLRIVYYGGHGRSKKYSTEPPIWFASVLKSSLTAESLTDF